MEIKKTPKADLENKRPMWILIGYVVALSAIYVAFEWTDNSIKIDSNQAIKDMVFEEEMIPITQQEEEVPPALPKTTAVTEVMKVVDDKASEKETNVDATEEVSGSKEGIDYVPMENLDEDNPEEQTIFQVVDRMPEYPGGLPALMQFLNQHIQYPLYAQQNAIQGRVLVQFIVNKDGTLADLSVVRGVDSSLDKEALRVISLLPRWTPGIRKGKSVRVKYTLPVSFRLQ